MTAFYGFVPEQLFPYDQGGAPFCGMAAVDTAVGRPPIKCDDYVARSAGHEDEPWEVVGTNDFLRQYALERGHNLSIIGLDAMDAARRDVLVNYGERNGLPRIVLGYYRGAAVEANHHGVGHYVVMFKDRASEPKAPEVIPPTSLPFSLRSYCKRVLIGVGVGSAVAVCPAVILPLAVKAVVLIGLTTGLSAHPSTEAIVEETYSAESDRDMRSIVNQRDAIVSQDSYSRIRMAKRITFVLTPFNWYVTPPLCRYIPGTEQVYVVSNLRVNHVYHEMVNLAATGRDPLMALPSASMLREVNTDSSRADVSINTLAYLRFMAGRLSVEGVCPSTRGLVAVSVDPMLAFVPAEAIENLVGADRVSDPVGVHSWRRDKTPFKPKMVAVAPIGSCLPVGLISDSSEPGLLNAFVGRAMVCSKQRKRPEAMKFVNFSCEFVRDLVSQTPVDGLVENPVMEEFASHYKGKRSATFIADALSAHERFLGGRMSLKESEKYHKHGFFVKRESNIKKSDGTYYMRNRGIMTMCDRSRMDCINIVRLLHAWNEGPVKAYQVKGLDSVEMEAIIGPICNEAHCVTDMSAFESSINGDIRQIEEAVLLELCRRAGFLHTRKAIRRLLSHVRKLYSRHGIFFLDTRCSGDFWTSFGNGLVNLCLCAYAAHSRGEKLRAIVEGDDGLTPLRCSNPSLVLGVGFKFSCEVFGTQPGDCDFLQCRWVGGFRIMNVARSLKVLWVRTPVMLKRSKLMYLLRCAGASLHHLSPGHPVLFELVNRIGRETSGAQAFKNAHLYLNVYKGEQVISKFPKDIVVNEGMRKYLAEGAIGFPPISLAQQLELERRFREDDEFYLGNLLTDYSCSKELIESQPESRWLNKSKNLMEQVYTLLELSGALKN